MFETIYKISRQLKLIHRYPSRIPLNTASRMELLQVLDVVGSTRLMVSSAVVGMETLTDAELVLLNNLTTIE